MNITHPLVAASLGFEEEWFFALFPHGKHLQIQMADH